MKIDQNRMKNNPNRMRNHQKQGKTIKPKSKRNEK